MKLEYIADNSAGGKYPNAWPASLIRLFDFGEQENQQLIALLSKKLFSQQADIELADIDFISPLNCRLVLRLSANDGGISALTEPNSFACDLCVASCRQLIARMQRVGNGYQWLDESSASAIEFLYSAGSTW